MMSQYQTGRPDEREDEHADHHDPEQKSSSATWMDQTELLHLLRRQLGATLEGIDRLVLGAVILEHPLQVRQQPDQHDVADQHGHADQALDDDERVGAVDRQPAREQRRPDLEERQREADRDHEGDDDLPARDLGRDLDRLALGTLLGLLLHRVVGGDGECAKADRERLTECDDATDHRQPPDADGAASARRPTSSPRRSRRSACGRRQTTRPGRASSHLRARPDRHTRRSQARPLIRGGGRRPSRDGAGSARPDRRHP